MLKSLKNITHCISYSLGHGIRPSILIKAPIGQKYLQRKEAREQGQDTKQAKMFSKSVWFAGASSQQYSFLSEFGGN